MSKSAEIAARTQRFNEAVRDFKLPLPSRHAKLMPLKDGILELRQKGASRRLIRELLATVGVAVGTDTIARFLTEVNGEQPPRRSSKRSRRRRAAVLVSAAATPITSPALQPLGSKSTPTSDNRGAIGTTTRSRSAGCRSSQPLIQRSLLMNKQINLIINGKGGVGKSFFATTFVQISQRLRHRSLRDRHRARELDAQALPSTIGVH
jgi:hypothetical protein